MKRTTPRRSFLGHLAIGAAALASARKAAAAPLAGPAPATAPGTRPAGDLARRIDLTARRLTQTGVPAYTEDFVLADVTLDTRRRFWNFSGDLSGRWIEALAVLPPAGRSPADLAPLVAKLLAQQRPDGRFGRTDLAFTAAETGNEHMALLWGNGRLLVGLMAYWQVTRDAAVLAAARRLAGFLLAVREAAKAPEVMARVEGQGAFGFICFTQLAEGLAMLSQATGDGSYAIAAREIVPLLPPRGVQHSHGYLSTLRGAVLLHEAAGQADMLAFAERLYGELVRSSDYTIDGGVMEYFGWGDPANAASLAAAKAASGFLPRNEGCGLADFVRLSLQLHRRHGPGRVPRARRALPRERLRPEPVRERRLRLAGLLRPGHPAVAQRQPVLVVLHDARLPGLPGRARPRDRRARRSRFRPALRGRGLPRRQGGPRRAPHAVGPRVRGDERLRGRPGRPRAVVGRESLARVEREAPGGET